MRILFGFLLLVFAGEVQAQLFNFRNYGIKEGLPQSTVYDIIQDKQGYLWLGTGAGLVKFDGKNCKLYTTKNGLCNNVIRSLHIDASGLLWIGTENGIGLFDGNRFSAITKKQKLVGKSVLCFLDANANETWCGTDDGGINIVSKKEGKTIIRNIGENEGLSGLAVFDLLKISASEIWALTYTNGISRILLNEKGQIHHISKLEADLPSNSFLSGSIDGAGNTWLATVDAGLLMLPPKHPKKYLQYNSGNSLVPDYVWKVYVDKSGHVWAATTDRGIFRIKKTKEGVNIEQFGKDEGLASMQILSMYADAEGQVIFGSGDAGLSIFRGDRFSNLFHTGVHPEQIQGINGDAAGNIWAVSSQGILLYLKQDDPKSLKLFSRAQGFPDCIPSSIVCQNPHNKNIWMGTIGKGLIKYDGKSFTRYTTEQGLINDRIYSLSVDNHGIVWIGTAGGISRYDGVHFLNISTEKMMMENNGVKCIITDKYGNTWFGTSGGIARYSGDGTLRTFDEKEGLTSKDINALAEDENGNIWIGANTGDLFMLDSKKPDTSAISLIAASEETGTNTIRFLQFEKNSLLLLGTFHGFMKISLDRKNKIKHIQRFREEDGFTGIECNDNAVYKSPDGNIWLGTVKGLSVYKPSFDKSTSYIPEASILQVQLQYKDVEKKRFNRAITSGQSFTSGLDFNYRQNQLTFKFKGVSVANPEHVFYRYRLTGNQQEWSPAQPSEEVSFSGLEPGNYSFSVMASCDAKNWSAPATYLFSISPPWYNTNWFRILALLLLVLGFIAFVKYREKKLENEKKHLEGLVAARTREVREQKEELAKKNEEITDSIHYALHIQQSILPPLEEIRKSWKDTFVFYQPKDIVSGDFYWFRKISADEFLIACADCTGHGVPGGFMSMLCADTLLQCSKDKNEPEEILFLTNNSIKETLRQDTEDSSSKDGMEICLLKINTYTRTITYSGANRSLYVVHIADGLLEEYKPAKAGIASSTPMNYAFAQHEIHYRPGTMLYATSDGFGDQFGGADGKKYMTKRMKEFFVSISSLGIQEQEKALQQEINTWKGTLEQVDDLLVIGIQL